MIIYLIIHGNIHPVPAFYFIVLWAPTGTSERAHVGSSETFQWPGQNRIMDAPVTEYSIPPQIFDFTEHLGELSPEESCGAFGSVFRVGLGAEGRKFLAVKVPRKWSYDSEEEMTRVR